ncbi:hypothetical protein VTI28DRAFT_6906 [Corynascus sepedonium]
MQRPSIFGHPTQHTCESVPNNRGEGSPWQTITKINESPPRKPQFGQCRRHCRHVTGFLPFQPFHWIDNPTTNPCPAQNSEPPHQAADC